MKLYGNLTNRFEEGKNYTGRKIKENDDITMYMWSDRYCYYITKVIDQKHILVKKYHVCADHSKSLGTGHQEWLYFKTLKEKNQYLNSCNLKDYNGNLMTYETENLEEDLEEEWVYKYNSWRKVIKYNENILKAAEQEGYKLEKYRKLSGNISFGVRDYYYDWEF